MSEQEFRRALGYANSAMDLLKRGQIPPYPQFYELLYTYATGDTLGAKELGVKFEPIEFPNPVFSMAVHPTTKAAVDKLGTSLQRLVEEDPGLQLSRDAASAEIILAGLGDAHLDVTIDRLKRKFNVELRER